MSTTAGDKMERIVFLSPSDFTLGDISFEAGLYAVQQVADGPHRAVVLTRIAGAGFPAGPYAELDEDDDAAWLCYSPVCSAMTRC